MPYNRLKACRHGQMLYNVNDEYVGRSFDLYGEFSEGEIDLFREIVRPTDIVLDVGANIGAHTVFLAQTAYAGTVLAFEPQRLLYQTLCANVALNSITNVFCIDAAVGEQRGAAIVPDLDPRKPFNFGGVPLEGWTNGRSVEVIPLDEIPLASCRLLKADVEGMEAAVLRGARQLIARHRPILYVESDRLDREPALLALFRELGYDAYWHSPPLFNPFNFARNPENVFGETVSHNVLCLPKESDEKALAERLEAVG